MSITTFSDLRNNLKSILDDVVQNSTPVMVPRKNGNVVIVSEDDWKSMEETLYLNSSPTNREVLQKSKQQLDEGGGIVYNSLDELFEDVEYVQN